MSTVQKSSKSAVTSSHSNATIVTQDHEETVSSIPASIANVPSLTSADIQAIMDAIETFGMILGGTSTLPNQEDARRLLKARRIAPSFVPTVANLATRYKITSQAFPVDAMLARQELVKTLVPVAERIQSVLKLVSDVSMVAQSGAWEGALVNYGLLKSESRGNPMLSNALEPLREEMRVKYVTPEGTKTVKRSRAAKSKTPSATVTPSQPSAAPAALPAATTPAAAAPPLPAAQPQVAQPATPNATLTVSAIPAVVTVAKS